MSARIDPTEFELLDAACRRVAARYKRRCWWASVADLRQAAWLAALEARRHWDPKVGVPLDAYVETAVARQLARTLWRESSPVHVPTGRGADEMRAIAGGLRKAGGSHEMIHPELSDQNEQPLAMRHALASSIPSQERTLAVAAAREVLHLVAVREPEDALALRVLLDDETRRDVAADAGLGVDDVKKILQRATRRIANSLDALEALRGACT